MVKLLAPYLKNLDGITLWIDVGIELGSLDGYFDGSNDGKLEGLLIGDSLGYTDDKVLGSGEGTNRAGLKWLGAHVVVVGWMFGGVGCHVTGKGAELSCELDYTI